MLSRDCQQLNTKAIETMHNPGLRECLLSPDFLILFIYESSIFAVKERTQQHYYKLLFENQYDFFSSIMDLSPKINRYIILDFS